ncbi:folylpolyglutamate synthase/dihydrofolate synthase family protein [Isosphaeraceae bacterium EP7]
MPDDYQGCLDYLYGRLNYERVGMPRTPEELRLGRMRALLRRLGNPQDAYRIVHVAGTKGKGSTCSMIAAAVSASGRRVGLFTSPHLHRLEERFVVDGLDADAFDLVELTHLVRPAVEGLDLDSGDAGHRGPTFFEVTTAMGLLHFARRNAEVVVLEVGLGGRLDSTNVVRPEVSVITPISLDHTRQLGQTLGAIAGEKAGIIKAGRPVVSGAQGDEPRAAIRAEAERRGSTLRAIDADFHYRFEPPARPLTQPEAGRVSVQTWRTDWGTLDLPLLGDHQALNAAVTLATLDTLAEGGIEVSRDAVVRGFAGLSVPARVEVIGGRPWTVIDGAHNVASAEALARTLKACLPDVPRTLVFGATREKDMVGQLRALLPLFQTVIVTRYVENPRAVPVEEIADAIVDLGRPTPLTADDPAAALELARRVTPDSGLICVTGSLFLAAETRALILGHEPAPGPGKAVP